MRKRTLAREYTLQILYQQEFNPEPPEAMFAGFWLRIPEVDPEVRDFAERLACAVREHVETINGLIEKAMEHWNLSRIVLIDKLVMQLAVAEFLYFKDIPPKVTINEAVNLAKKYSQEDSGKFVNGVLDRISHTEKLLDPEESDD